MKNYVIYLRKSRADRDAELRGEGETLARHEKTLIELANRMKLNISAVYKELVSGDTIAARPKMQQLLSEVEQGMWDGVLVMEVERLARGNTIDQGIVAQAFQISSTLIITPLKVFDPNNESDEEYFEFGLFMSRREYKTIKRRLQSGRIASVNEGKYVAGTAPFGYEKVKIRNDKGYTLKIIPDQANVVRMIYEWYTKGEEQVDGTFKTLGMYLIARKLDELRVSPMVSDKWSRSTIKDILTNPTYTGKIRWQWRKVIKTIENGKITEKRPKDKDCMLIDGIHEPIISQDIFNHAGLILSGKKIAPVISNKEIKNPFTGIIFCGKCGRSMTRTNGNTKAGYYSLRCSNSSCDNIASPIYLIEIRLIEALREWIENYKLDWDSNTPVIKSDHLLMIKQSAIKDMESELSKVKSQLNNTFNLLEQGVYSIETFTERNKLLSEKIDSLTADISLCRKDINNYNSNEIAKKEFMPKVEHLLDVYNNLTSASEKNELLKDVLEKVIYTKTERPKKGMRDSAVFQLDLFPKLPQE